MCKILCFIKKRFTTVVINMIDKTSRPIKFKFLNMQWLIDLNGFLKPKTKQAIRLLVTF